MVGGVRGGDVDDLDVGVGHELLVGAVGPEQAVLGGEGGRPAGVARPTTASRRWQVWRCRRNADEPAGDPAGAEHAPAEARERRPPPMAGSGPRAGRQGLGARVRWRAGRGRAGRRDKAAAGTHGGDDRVGGGAGGQPVAGGWPGGEGRPAAPRPQAWSSAR